MIDSNFIRLMFLFLPGIIATTILQQTNKKREKYSTESFFLYSFIFGITSYLILSLIPCSNFKKIILGLLNNKLEVDIQLSDIFLSFIVGIIIGLTTSFIRTKGILQLVFSKLNISYSLGFKSALSTLYSSLDKDIIPYRSKWVCIKLFDQSAIYHAQHLHLYAEHESYIEITLCNVDITLKGKKVYNQNYVYLNLTPGTFHIEYYAEDSI